MKLKTDNSQLESILQNASIRPNQEVVLSNVTPMNESLTTMYISLFPSLQCTVLNCLTHAFSFSKNYANETPSRLYYTTVSYLIVSYPTFLLSFLDPRDVIMCDAICYDTKNSTGNIKGSNTAMNHHRRKYHELNLTPV